MLRFFASSFSNWHLGADIVSLGVPTLPVCAEPLSLSALANPCYISLAASHLQRWSLWLKNTSLFSESWLLVVSNEANWWWSAEVCLFTVGAWSAYLQTQRRRLGIPHAWAYMLLGQTVAISFAASLFGLAVALRALPDGTLVQRAVFRSYSDDANSRDSIVKEAERDDTVVKPLDGDTQFVATKSLVRTVTHYSIETPNTHPRLSTRLLLWASTSLAALTVLKPNQSFMQVLTMHLLPFVPTLPSSWLRQLSEHVEKHLLYPKLVSDDEAADHASNARLKALLRPSRLFGIFALFGVASKLITTLTVMRRILRSVPIREQLHYGRVKLLLRLLYPTTFHSHPAQSSISSDALCLALVTVAQISWDSVQLPTSIGDRTDVTGEAQRARHTAAAITLAVLTPVLGPSITFSAWLALREDLLEEAELADEAALRKAAGGHDTGLIVSETKEEIVETIQRLDRGSGQAHGKEQEAAASECQDGNPGRSRDTRECLMSLSESVSPAPSPPLTSKGTSKKWAL